MPSEYFLLTLQINDNQHNSLITNINNQAGLLVTEEWSSVRHVTWEKEQKKTHSDYASYGHGLFHINGILKYPHWKLELTSFYIGKGTFLIVYRFLSDF